MADIVVVANTVALVSGNKIIITANAVLTPGLVVVTDQGGRAVLAKNDISSNAAASGLTLCSAVIGQPVVIAQAGAVVTLGANNVVVQGGCYHVSANAGAMAPEADFTTGQWVTQIGRANSITTITLELNAYGYTHG